MSSWKKLAAAPAASGVGLNVEDVFSTYLYRGTGSSQTITNNMDLSTEGGMVWIKNRTSSSNHVVTDTVRNWPYHLVPNSNIAEETSLQNITGFTTSGFTLGTNALVNNNNTDFASWTFRNQEKFFTHVKYTGDGTSSRNISHDLNHTVGFIMIKCISTNQNWVCYHREVGATKYLQLNTSAAASTGSTYFNNTAPTSSQFTVGSNDEVNESGRDYMAYIFAHNDGDGGFGINSDQDIIKCGSYTGDGTSNASNIVNVGFEPQWILVKKTSGAANWIQLDNMRGFVANITQSTQAGDRALSPDQQWQESVNVYAWAAPTPNGFALENNFSSFNENGATYIYVAIRRGPMGLPESGDDVFETATRDATEPSFDSGWPVDMAVYYNNITTLHSKYLGSRMQGIWIMSPNSPNAPQDLSAFEWDYMDGYYVTTGTSTNYISHMWRRYPQCFDVVCYTGNGTAGRTENHNLEVAPEMMWVKKTSGSGNWQVYHASQGAGKYSPSFRTDPFYSAGTSRWNNTTPTDTVFTLGSDNDVNGNGQRYIAYLFATLSGITKVGSYSGTGSNINVDCGFSNGAKFIMIKRADTEIQSTTHWYVWDSLRGITTGNDPYLEWDTVAAQVTNTDYIDPLSSGFTVTSSANSGINASGGTYIFYAVAA